MVKLRNVWIMFMIQYECNFKTRQSENHWNDHIIIINKQVFCLVFTHKNFIICSLASIAVMLLRY